MGSAGYDLFALGDIALPGYSEYTPIRTGIGIRVPQNIMALIAPRSGNTKHHGIDVGAGIVDPDYGGKYSYY